MMIYKITNFVNKKIYIGLTTKTIEERWCKHKERINSKRNTYLYNSMRKYGINNFSIEQIDRADTIEELNLKEKYWANFYNSYYPNGYNLKECGGNLGCASNESTILKRSKTYKIKSPTGEILKITNLKRFCINNNLDVCHLYKVLKGKRLQHNGWTKEETILPYVTLKSPDDKIHKLVLFYGSLAKFCRNNNIPDMTGIYMLIYNYGNLSYKGWTVIDRYGIDN